MQLDLITANIRLRNPWEAMDLGFALVRNWWKEIYLPWIMLCTLISITAFVVLPREYAGYGAFIVWWLKPLYDRFILNILGRRLFSGRITAARAFQELPALLKTTGLLSALTFRRPSFSRGFNLPIWQLEQQRGVQRAERQKILHLAAHTHAIGLTIGMLVIESLILLSFYGLIYLFLPENLQDAAVIRFFTQHEMGANELLLMQILNHVLYTLAIIIAEPFYVAASFTLYLNRRTQLEAWDIELAFRNLAQRLKKASTQKATCPALIPFLAVVLLSANPVDALAADTTASVDQLDTVHNQRRKPAEAAGTIGTIMQLDELSNTRTEKKWVHKKKPDDSVENTGFAKLMESLAEILKPVARIISVLFESALWLLILAAIIVLFYTREKWLAWFRTKKSKQEDYIAPEILFGMDIREDSLPENIPESARKLWQQGQQRNALGLLYRGVLAHLINQDHLALTDSQTEGDILKQSKRQIDGIRFHYIEELTRYWRQIAYAHTTPGDAQVTPLFDRWQSDFIGEQP